MIYRTAGDPASTERHFFPGTQVVPNALIHLPTVFKKRGISKVKST